MMRLFLKILVLAYFIIMEMLIENELDRRGSSDAMLVAVFVNAAVMITALSVL